MRLWWQEGTVWGHPIPPFKACAGFWVIFIPEQALLDFVLLLAFSTNPQRHFPEPRSAHFHTELSVM